MSDDDNTTLVKAEPKNPTSGQHSKNKPPEGGPNNDEYHSSSNDGQSCKDEIAHC